MELINSTKMQAGYTMGVDVSARESIVVAVKGTFGFPKRPNDIPELIEQQSPLIMSDTFSGAPGFSAPIYEVDYSPIKPFCDVILIGSAYAPAGKPATQVQVGMKVGSIIKTFMVIGDRHWEIGAVGSSPSKPQAFKQMSISYDQAFGGVDNFHADPSKHSAYMLNPVGKGYHRELDSYLVAGTPLPNTEELNQPIRSPDQNYKPMSFGVIGRNWEPRYRYAGTYDDAWLEHEFPFLPKDFDNRYFQCAPADQQMPYPKGGEDVVLVNLTANERVHFQLPTLNIPVVFFRKKGEPYRVSATLDTIILEPDKDRFNLTWRASIELRKNIFEIPEILVGNMSKAWWRAHELGKAWYPSIAHLHKARKRELDDIEEDT